MNEYQSYGSYDDININDLDIVDLSTEAVIDNLNMEFYNVNIESINIKTDFILQDDELINFDSLVLTVNPVVVVEQKIEYCAILSKNQLPQQLQYVVGDRAENWLCSLLIIGLVMGMIIGGISYFRKRTPKYKKKKKKIETFFEKTKDIIKEKTDFYCYNCGFYYDMIYFKSIIDCAKVLKEKTKKDFLKDTGIYTDQNYNNENDIYMILDYQNVINSFNEFIRSIKEKLDFNFNYHSSEHGESSQHLTHHTFIRRTSNYNFFYELIQYIRYNAYNDNSSNNNNEIDLDEMIVKCDFLDKLSELQDILLPIKKLLESSDCLSDHYFQDLAIQSLITALGQKDVSVCVCF